MGVAEVILTGQRRGNIIPALASVSAWDGVLVNPRKWRGWGPGDERGQNMPLLRSRSHTLFSLDRLGVDSDHAEHISARREGRSSPILSLQRNKSARYCGSTARVHMPSLQIWKTKAEKGETRPPPDRRIGITSRAGKGITRSYVSGELPTMYLDVARKNRLEPPSESVFPTQR